MDETAPYKQRKKNLGFKSEGEDTKHDIAYQVLEALPRRVASSFVAEAIYEYFQNHKEGKQIQYGSGQRKVINLYLDENGHLQVQKFSSNCRQKSFFDVQGTDESTYDEPRELDIREGFQESNIEDEYAQLFNGFLNNMSN